MKFKIHILLMTLLLPGFAFGQVTKERDVVANGGDYSSAPALALSWTVGEVAVATQQSSSLIVTEGFQQADADLVGINASAFPGAITIYPNPVQDQLFFEVMTSSPTQMSGEIYDLNGKLVRRISNFKVNRFHQGEIDFSQLPAGKWLLRFTSANQSQKTFTVLKVH